MNAFKAVIFDYDGTLFDSRPAIIHCIRRAFAAAARPVPADAAILATVERGLALQDTFVILDPALGGDASALDERIKCYRDFYLAEGTPLLKPFAGVGAVLRRLHAGGVRCLVISNKGVAAIHRSLEASGLAALIDLVLADAPGMPHKPDPALVTNHVLPAYPDLQIADILMVGDTETDILFAKASGMRCCWVSYGYGEAEHCRALAPEYEIAGIEELPALVLAAGIETPTSSG